jgi:DNA-binding NtrC family response regulator
LGIDILDPQNVSTGEACRTSLAGMTLAEIEKQAILETLEACNGNKAMTARTLGISEKSIYNKMRKHGIQS